MARRWAYVAMGAMALCLVAGPSFSADDVAQGRNLFVQRCALCHSTEPGVRMSGPSLAGIVGRKAASQEGFPYSQALRNAGIVWTPEALDAWLENPLKDVPGTHMSFGGIPDAAERAALIAYLKSL